MQQIDYDTFLKAKVKLAQPDGFPCDIGEISTRLKLHNRLMVKWLVEGGRRACFASFGLHKTVTQLETIRVILNKAGGKGLIVCPLGVRQEFRRDAVRIMEWNDAPAFIRRTSEITGDGIYVTNYESIREGKIDTSLFTVVSLDEASCLRDMGTKTFGEFMRHLGGGLRSQGANAKQIRYRFVCTATPSPNEYTELLAYAAFLGVSDVSQTRTRFFKRDSTKADKLTLHPHKEKEFWMWVASWALFITQPSDITGNPADDTGYVLPQLSVRWHELPSDHSTAVPEKNGQGRMFKNVAIGVQDSSKEKKESLSARIQKMLDIRAENPAQHRIIWHDLEPERFAIEKAIPGVVSVYGKQDLEIREQTILDFSDGKFTELAAKPVIAGSGCNFQRHCHHAIYLGIGFKFNDFIQSIHRLLRFLQTSTVQIDLIYTEAEREVRRTLERKWQQHNKLVKSMTDLVREFGLSNIAMAQTLVRKMGTERIEVKGKGYTMVNHDNVPETRLMKTNSAGLILTSWPFGNQYEYSPNYADFGHTDNADHFFTQMDFLTPECYRVLKPGRIYALHVKDRIMPSAMTGHGFQEVYPFHVDAILHMKKHGFGFLGMKTIVTDVVRENNQTYRLGWTEQCKDGTKMGYGLPEYLLLFRKPPTDASNGYGDEPVVKDKPLQVFADGTTQPYNDDQWKLPNKIGTGFSRARWQFEAHGFTRSNGERHLTPEEFKGLTWKQIYRLFKDYTLNEIFDFEHIVKIGEELDNVGSLPTDFMLLQPQSWHDDVWTDIARMLTMNTLQSQNGKEMHVCPMQFDIADRVIKQMSNPGDVVYDPFAGLGTVPLRAVKWDRVGLGVELSPQYFTDACYYLKAAEYKKDMPTLFDTLVDESEGVPA